MPTTAQPASPPSDKAVARLRAALDKNRKLVANQFRDTLVGGEEEPLPRISDAARASWQAASDRVSAEQRLAVLGFAIYKAVSGVAPQRAAPS